LIVTGKLLLGPTKFTPLDMGEAVTVMAVAWSHTASTLAELTDGSEPVLIFAALIVPPLLPPPFGDVVVDFEHELVRSASEASQSRCFRTFIRMLLLEYRQE
jgi:hypothetical protein